MGNHQDDQSSPQVPGAGGSAPGQSETAAEAAKIESPALVPPQSEATASDANATQVAAPELLAPLPRNQAPATVILEKMRASDSDAPHVDGADAATRPAQSKRWLLPLAASFVIAAALGALVASLATSGLGSQSPSAPVVKSASTDDVRALKEAIVRINTEMVALKAAVDNAGRSANTQLARVGERLDRFERAQAEPAAKLAKITDAIERLERRAPAANANEATGSVAAAAPSAEPARPPSPAIVDGWVLRSVYNGAALIQGRYGIIAVEPGDHLPGLGRIENIRKHEGRWVVVTTKGLIVTR